MRKREKIGKSMIERGKEGARKRERYTGRKRKRERERVRERERERRRVMNQRTDTKSDEDIIK